MAQLKDEHELRSYGRRRGRKPSERQAALLRDYLPQVAFDNAKIARRWSDLARDRVRRWRTSSLASTPASRSQAHWLRAIRRRGYQGARHRRGRRAEERRYSHGRCARRAASLAPSSIERAFILFPDPWPKRKHRKRRLVNTSLLDLLALALRPGAELRIGTDIGDYARTMLEAFAREPRLHLAGQKPCRLAGSAIGLAGDPL